MFRSSKRVFSYWGSELPCWGVHAVGRWTLLLGVLRMLHLGFVPQGYKKG
eukprot:CCRYP_003304-RA/>CCRYP_003304-RA protein AED:0.00 eAED:0.00 QI:38/1/1/1/0/0/2/63/49